METRLEPTGMLLLESLDLQDLTYPIYTRAKEEFRYCSEVFIVLTREVIIKDATGMKELEGPCKLLLEYASSRLLLSGSSSSLELSKISYPSRRVPFPQT